MAIRDALLSEFDHEMISTRQTLERVPEGKGDWAPHPKSMKMGRLAGHLAQLSGWSAAIIGQDSLDFPPASTDGTYGHLATRTNHGGLRQKSSRGAQTSVGRER